MADSDSGTHISDTMERNEEETELKLEDKLEPITETNSTNSVLSENNERQNPNKGPGMITNQVKREIKTTEPASPRLSLAESQVTERSELSQIHTRRQIRQDERTIRPDDRPTGNRLQRVQLRGSQSNVTTAHVHTAPRLYRKLNGDVHPPSRRVRRQRSLPPETRHSGISYAGRRRGMHKSLESIPAPSHSGVRNAYEFMDASRFAEINRRPPSHKEPKSKQVDIMDISEKLDGVTDNDVTEHTSWSPTGIYAVFVITLWTAVLKLMDSIDKNGPLMCSEGEEVRQWICSGCLSGLYFLAEVFWKRKGVTKALFGTVLVFAYMIVGHAEPLSCRLGADKVDEISKWQAATNFFFGAILGAWVYQDIARSVRNRRQDTAADKRRRRGKDEEDESSGDDFEAMRVYRIV
ncbi:uncharacterized protein LOC116618530 [Nematostella vectensis]|uniref:uncharacterized protein LOC116618530 n=1 Tax=Nematostella vectensis TaxID=45351 RepID=UPI00207778B5|nr:uncharacterized protein LOC116618530 [Nematostella vectensis]